MPAKRRRCSPFAASSSTSPGIKVSESKPSSFGESVTAPVKLTPGLFIFFIMAPGLQWWLDSFKVSVTNTQQLIICIFNQLYYLTPLFPLHHEYFYRVRARWVMHEDRCVDFFMSFCWFLCSILNSEVFVILNCGSVFAETWVFCRFHAVPLTQIMFNQPKYGQHTQRCLHFLRFSKLVINWMTGQIQTKQLNVYVGWFIY